MSLTGDEYTGMMHPMDKQAEFVAKRLAAHAAGTQDIAKDPLVQAAMEAQRQTADVMARWKELRAKGYPIAHTGRAFRLARQAD